ncbi:hypothetical protein H6A65_00355 [Mediterraneibacter glycyrrhizinilyticus]|nr:hypothetical protein [Mediterraneibacter glycyrrhizinilyticus]MBM6749954.1 hypothetical protein [Mediterraneibacter glycyrrhizinilyticus]
MIKVIIVVALSIFLLFIYSLAVTAKRADQDMERLLHRDTDSDAEESR